MPGGPVASLKGNLRGAAWRSDQVVQYSRLQAIPE